MTLCYLGLGSNLHKPQRQLRRAINLIANLPKTTRLQCSQLYVSRPYGVHAQPNFYNAVVAVQTALSAKQLLLQCRAVEHQLHRVRKKHCGPRTIDIDLLLFGKQTLNTRFLTIPHPNMLQRDFVLTPLLEINPSACLPTGEPIAPYLTHCERYIYVQ